MALAMLFSCEKPILNEEDANDTPKTITLTGGHHQLTFAATDNADAYLNGSILRQETMGDTFLKSIDINTQNAPANQRIVLERMVAGILYKGEGTVTLSGLRNSLSLSSAKPAKATTVVIS